MFFIKALFSILVTFTVALGMTAPTVDYHGTNFGLNGTDINNTTLPISRVWGDRLSRVNAYPYLDCRGIPTTFDFVGEGGKECWNYKNVLSLRMVAMFVQLFYLLYFILLPLELFWWLIVLIE